ncbi:MAG: hypothetical protein AMJ81_12880 [Phycisphaerae bacterium SM23_33]|jgi:phage FluMu protein Com|nr:MAG: hypothetical protein AMJ81_12880 [Phycisphaerae bacterium SM23_33]
MTITFRCEHCGKKVEAPDSAGGKRGRCPYCKQSCYVPSPVGDDELYDFAPEDEELERRRRREQEALRQHEQELIAEIGRGEAAPVPLEQREDLQSEDLHHLVVNYCLDLSNSNLERAEVHLQKLKTLGPTATQAVDDFLAGKALEPALDQIPTRVLQGFLRQLRDALGRR